MGSRAATPRGGPTSQRLGPPDASALGLLVLLSAAIDTVASWVRYVHLSSGVDLAIFDQAIWHYSRFQAPYSSIKGEDLLGDHFHPLIAVLAPLFWVWSDPRMLLIAQAVLVSVSIVPVFLFARDRLGRAAAYPLAVGYGVFWGLQVGALYDFHELAFSPLLIACAILFCDRAQWRWFWLAIVLLLLVKEDMGLVVAFFGVCLLTRREVRHGLALLLVGVGWFELATHIFIPHFAAGHHYQYWYYGELGPNLPKAAWALITAPWKLVTIGLSPSIKAHTILALFAPFLLLSFGSRYVIVLIPLMLERFLSLNQQYWVTHYQYSLPIAPVLAMSAVAGLSNLARRLPKTTRHAAVIGGCTAILIVNLVVTLTQSSDAALTAALSPSHYRTPTELVGAGRALARVPSGASIATTESLLAHVSQRTVADAVDDTSVKHDAYLLVDILHPGCCNTTANFSAIGAAIDAGLADRTPIFYDRGWTVLRASPRPGNGVLAPMPAALSLRVGADIRRWQTRLYRAGPELVACARGLTAGSATHSRACLRDAVAGLAPAERAGARALSQARATLSGDCAQIGHAAAAAFGSITSDVDAMTVADTPRRFGAAYARFVDDELAEDRIGLIDRFVVLCSPR